MMISYIKINCSGKCGQFALIVSKIWIHIFSGRLAVLYFEYIIIFHLIN